ASPYDCAKPTDRRQTIVTIADFGLRIADFGLRIVDCGLKYSSTRFPILNPRFAIRAPQSPIRNPRRTIPIADEVHVPNPQSEICNPQSAIRNRQSAIISLIGADFDLTQKVLCLLHALVLDLFEAARLGLGAPVSDSAIEHQQVEVPGVIV